MKRTIQYGRKVITFLSVLSILAVSVFSALIGVDFTAVAQESQNINVWGGQHENIDKTQFADGSGSAVDPYIITNGDQLYSMVINKGQTPEGNPYYYKLANDIYLNDISNYNKWGKSSFDMSSLNNWNDVTKGGVEYKLSGNNYGLYQGADFAGVFDGDGHTIYGLYSEGPLFAGFLPKVSKKTAEIKNVHFRNSYCVNTHKATSEELEKLLNGDNNQLSLDCIYNTAAVIVGYGSDAFAINNCSVKDAYVEASAFAGGLIGAVNYYHDGGQRPPVVKNCLIADIDLNATRKEAHLYGVEGGIIGGFPFGRENVTTIESVIVAGVQAYGADDRDIVWNGYKIPTASYTFFFKNVYSDVEHEYFVEHATHGGLSFIDEEITVVKEGYLKGYKAKEKLDFDWEHNWKVVDGEDYPIPANKYITPTGDDYYEAGGPASAEDFWDGTAARDFAAGTGTAEDPYLIENCEQFYLMVSTLNADKNYKIADGVTALYFNNVKGLSYQETINVLRSKKMHTYAPGETNNFSGVFDGNGVTLYGIKAEGMQRSAIIPQSGNATLKNFTVKNSHFNATDGYVIDETKTEGAAAVVADLSTGANVSIRNVSVIDCKVNSNSAAAGLVACSHINGTVFIDDCIVSGGEIMSDEGSTHHAAFVATAKSGAHIIKNSISYGIYPAADNVMSYNSTFINVYTDFDAPSPLVKESTPSITQVETAALLGEAVKATAPKFDWVETWQTTDGIPKFLNYKPTLGTVGEVWSGKVADAYAGGNGTSSNPYQINTPERLAQMLNYSKAGTYYVLTEDIKLNDTTTANWQDNAKQWFTSEDVKAFEGIFDGNNHTIYGLCNKDVKSGVYAGLVPVFASAAELRNVKIDNSYFSGQQGSYIGAVVGTVQDNASNVSAVRAASIGENVTLTGAANAGGIIGRVGFTKLRMDNSIFYGSISATGKVGGLVGEVTGKLDISDSISVGVAPFVSAENVVCSGIYTDANCNIEGVTVLKNSEMIGENAKDSMTELDFGNEYEKGAWTTTTKYPVPEFVVQSFDGVKNQVWTGVIATNYKDGDGSEENPYLIETPEQLAKLMMDGSSTKGKYYKLVADILLNDISDSMWQAKVGCNTWLTSQEVRTAFEGHFDGDGYVVYGIYYNQKASPRDTYVALFPRIGGTMTIKNVGVSQAYIRASTVDDSTYAGGIFGMGSAFYNFYGNKNRPAETVGDVFLVPGDTEPTPLPSISGCFVDHTCYIEGYNASGIGAPGSAAIVIRDCIVTASLIPALDSRVGILQGSSWAECSRVYNSLAFAQTDNIAIGGAHQWIKQEGQICTYTENVYYYGSKYCFGVTRLKRPQWRVGEEAKTAMPELDWENTWRVEPDGTPVLRIFDKEGRSGSLFSDKQFNIADVKINFITGDSSIVLEPLVGKPYEKVTLPTISRTGYIFTGWYAFSDFSLLYPYEYFLSRDINVYAGWKKNGINQDFESYPYSMYDCDLDRWNYNKPGSRGGYKFEYVHTGTKSMQLLDNSAESADLLINYEDWLTIDQEYTMTFWVATDKANNAATLSLVQNNHPDYLDTAVSVEPIVTITGQQVGQWKQYSYNFTAKTNWVSIRATGNSSLFIDDVVIAPKGTIIADTSGNTVSGDINSVSPNTADTTTVIALVAAIACCAVILVVSKKGLTEVIEEI